MFSLYFFHFAHIRMPMLLYSSFPLLMCVVKTVEPLCWKNAKWSIVHLYTSIECDFWTLCFFFALSAYSAVLCGRCYCLCRCHRCCCCCNFCVSARDIFLYARDSATTFEECINIHIICVCQWTKVLVIIRPLIMTHWLSHTAHKDDDNGKYTFFSYIFATFIRN